MTNERLDYLVHSHLSGVLTDEEQAELEACLLADPSARAHFWDAAEAHVEMYFAVQRFERRGTEPSAAPVSATTTAGPPTPARRTTSARRPILIGGAMLGGLRDLAREPVMLAVIVVSLVSGSILAYSFSQHPMTEQKIVSAPPADEPKVSVPAVSAPVVSAPAANERVRPSARVTRVADARWDEAFAPHHDGMAKGQRLKLASGLAEITFDSQATVLVEGPAELEIAGDNSCQLSMGNLLAHVPTTARGFVVSTPTLRIVDLGTEFGVEVRSEGLGTGGQGSGVGSEKSEPLAPNPQPLASSTEVHVLTGKVTVAPLHSTDKSELQVAQQPPVVLKAGEAVRSSAGSPSLTVTPADASKFVRQIPPETKVSGLIGHWPLDGSGRAAVGRDTRFPVNPAGAALDRFGTPGRAINIERGRVPVLQRQLAIDEGGGLDGLKQGTISVFVKWVGKQHNGGAILARQQKHNHFTDNVLILSGDDPSTAVVQWMGAHTWPEAEPTIKVADPLKGHTPVGDGRWRHVAVTFGASQQSLYLDGVLENHANSGPREGLHRDPEALLAIGYWPGDGNSLATCVLDDLKIFDRELTAEEIKALATPPAPKIPLPVSERSGDGAAEPK